MEKGTLAMDFNPETTYVLTAPRTRATWQELYGNIPQTKSKRFRRGEKLEGIPDKQIARLVELGHAVPEEEWDPVKFRKLSANRRLAMNQAAAADARAAVELAKARESGQPVVGLEDADDEGDKGEGRGQGSGSKAEDREVDGIKVEDVDDMGSPDDEDAADLAAIEPVESDAADRYASMSYPDLQAEAKAKTGNGGGSKEDLQARLREHDANQQ